jgi:uncharacterized repeat protein (TIGR02543 family)
MVAAMFPAVALAAEGTYGEFTVTGDNLSGVSYEGGVLTVSSAAPVTISQTAGVGSSTTDRIEVTSVANITLNGVNIDVSSTEYTAAFRITSSAGEVNITLATGSTNTLKSGLECAGLQKDTTAEGTMLTIDGTGTLNAIGKDDFNYAGSGIGGGYKKAGSYITIAGGTVNAIGGQRCAGIGGGHQATGSSITITGGTVNATGGNMGAGIGGGSWSTGSNITISGGTVNAIATGYAEGIGKGGNGTGSTNITITGGNVKASSIGGPPTNGVANVYQAVIPIAGDTTGDIDVNSMTFTSNGSAYTYNMTGTKSILESGTGKVYVYLPGSSGGTATSANYGGITYVATVKNDNKAVFAPPSYSITYNLDGGTNNVTNPATYNVATATITLANATKTGYTFAGWFDAATDGNRVNEIALGSTGAKTLYARWTQDTYDITYNLDGGTNGANPGTYNVETATITLADATKTDYAFAGWFDAATDGNRVNEIALGSTGDKTLYARWTIISSGGGSSSSSPGSKGAGNSLVTVNGKSTSAGTEIRTTTDGISTNKVQVNNEVVNNKIKEAIEDHSTNVVNTIQISSSDKDSEVLSFELTGDTVKKLEENDFEVSVNNNDVEYIIPAKEFTISKVAEALNIIEKDLQKIKVEVRITKSDDKAIEQYNQMAKANGSELVFPPVSFEVVANTTRTDGSTGKVVISKFSNYVERVMEIPAGVDRNKITTGVVFNQDGTYSHVPTQVLPKDGKWYAKVSSLTNSTYSVIWNPIEVKSVEKHWSRDAVNDMASRLVVFNTETFAPNMAITRADFAEYIVRALGLYREGSMHENKFKDVSALGDRTLAILIANEYGIVSGYQDGTFKPDARITREEAMTMYQRAMKVTNLLGADTDRYQAYTDYNQVAGWAKPYVKDVLSAHVFNGKTATTISPKSNLTYGEAAQAIKNLLVESKLINK